MVSFAISRTLLIFYKHGEKIFWDVLWLCASSTLYQKDQKACTVIRWKWHIEHRSFAGKKQNTCIFLRFFQAKGQIDIKLGTNTAISRLNFKPGFFAVCGQNRFSAVALNLAANRGGHGSCGLLLGAPFLLPGSATAPMWQHKGHR